VTVGDDNGDDTSAPLPPVTINAPLPTSTASSDTATAVATAGQVDPSNINASVRVLSPGDNGPVAQTNTTTATALAGATGPAPATDGTAGTQTATPTASATQESPVNLNVSIRVGSPGDDTSVTQANTATATAGPVDPGAIDAAVAQLPADPEGPNSSGDVENGSIVTQDLGQCPDDGTACISAPAIPDTVTAPVGSAADDSAANAAVVAPSNINISIRVASPGADALLAQSNDATATAATSVTTLTDPDNLAVSVVVPGVPEDVVIPTDPETPWNWTWNWTTGTAPTDPTATPTGTPEWDWNWTPTPTPPATDSTPDKTMTPGTWTWTWTLVRGDWSSQWTYQQACNCTWNWNWSWILPADAPTSAPAAPVAPPAPPANPQVSQSNESNAAAAAVTSFDGGQSATLVADGGDAIRYQGITSIQTATASADTSQDTPLNVSILTAGILDGINQTNHVAAASTAAAFDTSRQTVEQDVSQAGDGAVHSVASTQVIGTLQTVVANADASQTDAVNVTRVTSPVAENGARIGRIDQSNDAVADSYTAVASITNQAIGQSLTGAGSDQTADALQLAVTSQQNIASSSTSQSSVKNVAEIEIPKNGAWNPPISQSNTMSSTSVSQSYSEIDQTAAQQASGAGIEWELNAQQTATVKQGGSASSSASQSNIVNVAHWDGTLAGPPTAPTTTSGAGIVLESGEPATLESLIFAGPSPLSAGIKPGRVFLAEVVAAARQMVQSGFPAAATGSSPIVRAQASAAARARSTSQSERFVHMLFKILGAGSSAAVLLIGATQFAALLTLFLIAALGAVRLQYAVPTLGRSADFARRERPG
jgi:hypothetical protein